MKMLLHGIEPSCCLYLLIISVGFFYERRPSYVVLLMGLPTWSPISSPTHVGLSVCFNL